MVVGLIDHIRAVANAFDEAMDRWPIAELDDISYERGKRVDSMIGEFKQTSQQLSFFCNEYSKLHPTAALPDLVIALIQVMALRSGYVELRAVVTERDNYRKGTNTDHIASVFYQHFREFALAIDSFTGIVLDCVKHKLTASDVGDLRIGVYDLEMQGLKSNIVDSNETSLYSHLNIRHPELDED